MRVGLQAVAMMPRFVNAAAPISRNRKVSIVAARNFAACASIGPDSKLGRVERFLVPKLPDDPDNNMKILLLLSAVVALLSSKRE